MYPKNWKINTTKITLEVVSDKYAMSMDAQVVNQPQYRFKILDHLPKIPKHLVMHAYEVLKESRFDISRAKKTTAYMTRVLKKTNQQLKHTYTQRYELGKDFQNWMRNNIVDDWTECTISRTLSTVGNTAGPHTDQTRSFVLMYVLDTGGNDCTTTWWQEKGYPYHRPGRLNHTVDDYETLDLVESIKLPMDTWCIMATDFLHSVENIERDRIAIHVGLMNDNTIKFNH